MDANIRLIAAVKQYPTLYARNMSLTDRKIGWQQLARDMRLPEQYPKSRWHILLQGFLRDNNFKYKEEMSFLLPHLEKKYDAPKEDADEKLNVMKPEFYITLKDLENTSDNEDYVFLEVEQLDEDSREVTLVEETQTEEFLQAVEVQQEREKEHQRVEGKFFSGNDQDPLIIDEQKHSINEKINSEEKVVVVPEHILEEMFPVDKSKNSSNQNNEKNSNQKSENSNERDEDEIFGSLVTAMVKNMPPNRKREVKREIMTILFQ